MKEDLTMCALAVDTQTSGFGPLVVSSSRVGAAKPKFKLPPPRQSLSGQEMICEADRIIEIAGFPLRRSGRPAKDHFDAVDKILVEMGFGQDFVTRAIGKLHDLFEDTDYPIWDVYCKFGPAGSGFMIADGVIGVTKWSWMTDEVYYQSIAEKAKTNWRVVPVKIADVLHCHADPFNGSRERELRKIEITRTLFLEMFERSKSLIPAELRAVCQSRVDQIMVTTLRRYDQLMLCRIS